MTKTKSISSAIKVAFASLFLLFGGMGESFATTSSAASLSACSQTSDCPNGFVCDGVRGEGGNISVTGMCTPNPIVVVLCRMVHYLTSRIARTFMLFSLIMVGIAFFLGKISWGMIMTVLLGTGMLYGSGSLARKLTGSGDIGFCDSIDAVTCFASGYGPSTDATKPPITNVTGQEYNLVSVPSPFDLPNAPACSEPLTCLHRKYQNIVVTEVRQTQNVVSSNGVILLNADGTNKTETVTNTKCAFDHSDYNTVDMFVPRNKANDADYLPMMVQKNKCQDGTITGDAKGTNISSGRPMDYFFCHNSCTDTDFAIAIDHKDGGPQSCGEIFALSMQQ